ncbi:trehalase [Psychroflexus sp. CAK8W]|uniref:Trehalase n=1 Tax=Psychroflexus longus TaxID=2873596 RepID=A0ABS7XI25_9FLAO|nr:trehalase family glycosidase [Psychroflexus longus]MBZ9778618.1 trehalase [Psychroflexus longus]
MKNNHIIYLVLIVVFAIGCQNNKETADFYAVDVNQTLQRLEAEQDTDKDKKITEDDTAQKSFVLKAKDGSEVTIEGTYHLSNLLQELAAAKNEGKTDVEISLKSIKEQPADRISRLIKTKYWDNLTRRVDQSGLETILTDTKASDGLIRRLYVPSTDSVGVSYFKSIESDFKNFEVVVLPENISPEYVKSINDKPGILSLQITNGEGTPFVVPGGRFNEMYGWDSYFEGVGLNVDGRQDLSIAMIENFAYQIQHYGKILNANRSYYLTRSQPPFMTSFIRETFESEEGLNEEWLTQMLNAALDEYFNVWMKQEKKLTATGLNRYFAEGIGIPPETEEGHFDTYLETVASQYQMPLDEFIEGYQTGAIEDEAVDEYFLHDRSLRESGHDTTWRLDGRCADLNSVALNALLYKYETDFAYLIKTYFDDSFLFEDQNLDENYWMQIADERKLLVNQFLWNEEEGSYYDYNFKTQKPLIYDSATNFYPLWSNLASPEQADKMKDKLLQSLKAEGGILSSSKASVEQFASSEVSRQWDYPNGWAPHQMLIWKGLLNYGYNTEAEELAYRWMWMITKNAVDYNGTIPEKYDVVNRTHKVYAEYGNVGTEFDYITPEGFGWMNASYQYGLTLLSDELRENLNALVDPDKLF